MTLCQKVNNFILENIKEMWHARCFTFESHVNLFNWINLEPSEKHPNVQTSLM